jgi:hypothetical protein
METGRILIRVFDSTRHGPVHCDVYGTSSASLINRRVTHGVKGADTRESLISSICSTLYFGFLLTTTTPQHNSAAQKSYDSSAVTANIEQAIRKEIPSMVVAVSKNGRILVDWIGSGAGKGLPSGLRVLLL